MIKKLLFFLLILFLSLKINAQETINDLLVRSTTGVSGASELIKVLNNEYIIQQSIGQTSAIGTFYNDDYTLRQGFIQPNILSKIIDKNIPLNLLVNVYPNPFVSIITLQFNEVITTSIFVTVFDITGRSVYTKIYAKEENLSINLNNLSEANYILKVIANNKQFIHKIIKYNP